MRRIARLVAALVAAASLALVAFEGFALWRAKQRTPEVLAEAAKGDLELSSIPKARLAMLLKVEDPGFYDHRGVDFSTPGAGATSITQSLVKRFYFDRFKPGFAKLEQSLIARFVLDPAMSKPAQLKAYLNHSYLGHFRGRAVIGFADAARTYYGRGLDQLTDREFLSLVAMAMAPNRLDPVRHPGENAERMRRIEALIAGKCKPAGHRDVTYEACAAVAR